MQNASREIGSEEALRESERLCGKIGFLCKNREMLQ